MAYLAFYRTFRPTSFDSVVRQEHIVKILKNQIETGKIGHAYLFCGPRGTGKTTLAKIFARAINCESPVNGSPCGKCPTCLSLASGAALDISEIDAASNNGVDEMRDLREKVQYPPVNGRYKVYIIDEVHMLTQSAFNAVLKTLEEPPAHAVFILATTEPQKIPATILSRCMRFDFKLIPQHDLEGLVKSVYDKTGKEYEDEAVAAIARAGNGSARDSLSIADMCASYSRGKLTYDDVNQVLGKADFFAVAELVSALLTQDGGETLSKCEEVLSTGKGVGVLLRDLLSFLNNLAIVKMCRDSEKIVNLPADKHAKLSELSRECDGHAILRATEILTKAEGDLRYAVDGRITLESALIKAAMPSTDYDIEALLTRIEKLERAVAEGVKVTIKSQPQPAQLPVQQTAQQPVQQSAQPVREEAQPVQQTATHPNEPKQPIQTAQPERQSERQPVKPDTTGRAVLNSFDDGDSPFDGGSPFDSPFGAAEDTRKDTQADIFGQPDVSAPSNIGSLSERDKSMMFGKFIKLLRINRRNAVLFTLCNDLESLFEGDTFVLLTPVEAIYRALNREENHRLMGEVLAELGVFSFEVRLKPKGENKYEKAISELRENFKGTDITIK